MFGRLQISQSATQCRKSPCKSFIAHLDDEMPDKNSATSISTSKNTFLVCAMPLSTSKHALKNFPRPFRRRKAHFIFRNGRFEGEEDDWRRRAGE